MKKNNKFELGLVLSGGSIRGIAHIGFLDRLSELKAYPDIIAGSSAGALVGAFFASGMSSKDMLAFFKSTPLFQYKTINPRKPGIFDTEKYIQVFKDFLPPTFEDLSFPLVVCAVNAESGEAEYFSSGELYRPLLASCSIPFIFAPMKINDALYIDGGVIDNYPIEQLEGKCDTILGSYVGNPGKVTKKQINTVIKISNRANHLLMYSAVRHKLNRADLTLEHPLHDFGLFEQKKIDEIYQVGYQYSLRNLDYNALLKINSGLVTKTI